MFENMVKKELKYNLEIYSWIATEMAIEIAARRERMDGPDSPSIQEIIDEYFTEAVSEVKKP
jgi:hypothetical protein